MNSKIPFMAKDDDIYSLSLSLSLSPLLPIFSLFKSEDFNSSIKEVPGTIECGFSSVCSGLSGLITFV